jgi:cyclic pyranopterin phosphate synthase
MDEPGSTSVNYLIPGFRGSVGFIAAWTRSFCGTCNRIRLTPEGMLKTCLYDKGAVSLRDILRNGATDKVLEAAILSAIGNRFKNGHEAEQARGYAVSESMATIGG